MGYKDKVLEDLRGIQNVVSFVYRIGAPTIKDVTVSKPTCPENDNGSITFSLGRGLYSDGEELSVEVYKKNAANGYSSIKTEPVTSQTHTIDHLVSGIYKLQLRNGKYHNKDTYTDGDSHHKEDIDVYLPAVTLAETHTNVSCHGGSDGSIALTGGGGNGGYSYRLEKKAVDGSFPEHRPWSSFGGISATSTVSGLAPGAYRIFLKDKNGCELHLAEPAPSTSVKKYISVTLTEPSAVLAITHTVVEEATAYGKSDGTITAKISGGTPDKTGQGSLYDVTWRKDGPSGNVIRTGISNTRVTFRGNPADTLQTVLSNLPGGKYHLSVTDIKYPASGKASDKAGCMASRTFTVDRPDPLTVAIQQTKNISCNRNNHSVFEIRDDFPKNGVAEDAEDGILETTVKGGREKTGYGYVWTRTPPDMPNHQFIPSLENRPTIVPTVIMPDDKETGTWKKFTEGNYKLTVTDGNGNTVSGDITVTSPAELVLKLTPEPIVCNDAAHVDMGAIGLEVSGGTPGMGDTPPYAYSWSASELDYLVPMRQRKARIASMNAGRYIVSVRDANGCTVTESTAIDTPGALSLAETIHPLTCYGGEDGDIEVRVSGGTPPYTPRWSNGFTGTRIEGLKAGSYTLSLEDSKGCALTRTHTLEEPAPVPLEIPKEITLCVGDSKDFDVHMEDPKASYLWTKDGGTVSRSPHVTLSEEGTYAVTVTDGKGCSRTERVTVHRSAETLDVVFTSTSLAYMGSGVVFVNISRKNPQTLTWIVPQDPNVEVLRQTDDNLELLFKESGVYTVGLKGTLGGCEKTFYKDLWVDDNPNPNPPGSEPRGLTKVRSFIIAPNPAAGDFSVSVSLSEASPIRVRLLNMTLREAAASVSRPASQNFEIPFSSGLPAGVYIVVLEIGREVLVKKLVME